MSKNVCVTEATTRKLGITEILVVTRELVSDRVEGSSI